MIRVSLMESGLPSSMLCDTRYILVLVCKMTEESFLGVLIAVVCAPISTATDYRPQTTDYRRQAKDYRLQTTDFRLQTTDFRLQSTDHKPQITD